MAEQLLDPKLFGDGEAYGSTSLTDLIVDKKKKKQQLPAGKKGLPVPIIPAPSRKERRASKSQQRKIAKLEDERAKKARRHMLYDSLQQTELKPEEMALLFHSGSLGHKLSAKETLARFSKEQQLGVKTDLVPADTKSKTLAQEGDDSGSDGSSELFSSEEEGSEIEEEEKEELRALQRSSKKDAAASAPTSKQATSAAAAAAAPGPTGKNKAAAQRAAAAAAAAELALATAGSKDAKKDGKQEKKARVQFAESSSEEEEKEEEEEDDSNESGSEEDEDEEDGDEEEEEEEEAAAPKAKAPQQLAPSKFSFSIKLPGAASTAAPSTAAAAASASQTAAGGKEGVAASTAASAAPAPAGKGKKSAAATTAAAVATTSVSSAPAADESSMAVEDGHEGGGAAAAGESLTERNNEGFFFASNRHKLDHSQLKLQELRERNEAAAAADKARREAKAKARAAAGITSSSSSSSTLASAWGGLGGSFSLGEQRDSDEEGFGGDTLAGLARGAPEMTEEDRKRMREQNPAVVLGKLYASYAPQLKAEKMARLQADLAAAARGGAAAGEEGVEATAADLVDSWDRATRVQGLEDGEQYEGAAAGGAGSSLNDPFSKKGKKLSKEEKKKIKKGGLALGAAAAAAAAGPGADSRALDDVMARAAMWSADGSKRVQKKRVLPDSAFSAYGKLAVHVRRPADVTESRAALPVTAMETEIMEALVENDILIVCGETGSGKTTQVPQFLYEAGYGVQRRLLQQQMKEWLASREAKKKEGGEGEEGEEGKADSHTPPPPMLKGFPGMIAVTQPRRVAATAMAHRVAAELGHPINGGGSHSHSHSSSSSQHNSSQVVGYQVRYDSSTVGPSTAMKFMTDGILLRELQSDLLLRKYSAIVLDEAHERNLNTDVLIGLLSRALPLRNKLAREEAEAVRKGTWSPMQEGEGGAAGSSSSSSSSASHLRLPLAPLKLIIMSATLRVEDFTGNAALFPKPPPVIKVSARQYPVTSHFARKTELLDYTTEAYRKAVKIHARLPEGGILIFLTGQDEIEAMVDKLKKRFDPRRKEERMKKRRLQQEQADKAEKEKAAAEAAATSAAAAAAAAGSKKSKKGAKAAADAGMEVEKDGKKEKETAVKPEDMDEAALAAAAAAIAEEEGGSSKGGAAAGAGAEEEEEEEDEGSAGPVHILPLYALLPQAAQQKVFAPPPPGHRLIVVATNVAETSLTIPGIRYVIDCGRVKRRVYDSRSGSSSFQVGWVSQASADQRAGRAGRTGPGHCYRLYSSAVFSEQFPRFEAPEMACMPIESLVLSLKVMGIACVAGFPFPSPPPPAALFNAIRSLTNLGALQPVVRKSSKAGGAAAAAAGSSDGSTSVAVSSLSSIVSEEITPLGRALAHVPLHPALAKVLVLAWQQQEQQAAAGKGGSSSSPSSSLLDFAIALVACMTVQEPFVRPSLLPPSSKLGKSGSRKIEGAGGEEEEEDGEEGQGLDEQLMEEFADAEEQKKASSSIPLTEAEVQAARMKQQEEKEKAARQEARNAAFAAHARFRQPLSDALTVLRAAGAHAYTSAVAGEAAKAAKARAAAAAVASGKGGAVAEGDAEAAATVSASSAGASFCKSNYLRSKGMKEVQQLRRQLHAIIHRELKTAFTPAEEARDADAAAFAAAEAREERRAKLLLLQQQASKKKGAEGKSGKKEAAVLADDEELLQELEAAAADVAPQEESSFSGGGDSAETGARALPSQLEQQQMEEQRRLQEKEERSLTGVKSGQKRREREEEEDGSKAMSSLKASAGPSIPPFQLMLTPPSLAQEQLLRQLLTAGQLERVARMATPDLVHRFMEAGHKPPCKGWMPYVAASSSAPDSLLYVHPSSAVFDRDAATMPQYLVYTELVEGKSCIYMRGCTAIESDWLHSLAAGTPLCSYEDPLESPPPRYSPAPSDTVMCWRVPLFGDKRWKLSPALVPFPTNAAAGGAGAAAAVEWQETRLRVFARAFLEGQVASPLADLSPLLTLPASAMTKKSTAAQPRVALLLEALRHPPAVAAAAAGVQGPICSARQLAALWRKLPSYLSLEYKAWLPVDKHAGVDSMWKKIVAASFVHWIKTGLQV